MTPPSPNDVDKVLTGIERASTPARQLAREAIARRRNPQVPSLTQASIDSGVDHEQRRQRFVSASVKFKRRSWWSRLFR